MAERHGGKREGGKAARHKNRNEAEGKYNQGNQIREMMDDVCAINYRVE